MKDMLLPKLFETAREFAVEVRQANLFSFAPHVIVHENDTLSTAMRKLAATRMHRVYIVDQDKPVGVVSLIDICKAILESDSIDTGQIE
jgi:CBS domain containing-hemolysin-like protein